MTDTLRDLDAEIARARGWARGRGGGSGVALGCWYPDRDATPLPDRLWHEQRLALTDHLARRGEDPLDARLRPPPFSSSWALAGPLLEEMPRPQLALVIGDSDWRSWFCEASPDQPTKDTAQYCATPCVAIARAWLAWHRSKS